jgi:hypothetical protein
MRHAVQSGSSRRQPTSRYGGRAAGSEASSVARCRSLHRQPRPDRGRRIRARTGKPSRARPRHSTPCRRRRVATATALKPCPHLSNVAPAQKGAPRPSRRARRRDRGATPCASRRLQRRRGVPNPVDYSHSRAEHRPVETAADFFKRAAGNASREDLRAFLASASDVPPEPGDEIPYHLRATLRRSSARG